MTAAFLRAGGAALIAQYGAESSVPEIAGIVAAGEETIGGVTLRHRLVADTEAPETLVIEIPALRAVIVADVLFNRVHMVLSRALDSWIAVLRDLERSPEGTTILAGHGAPATVADVPLAIRYLEAVRPMVAARRPAGEIVAEMTRAFPDHRIPPLLELGLSRVFAA